MSQMIHPYILPKKSSKFLRKKIIVFFEEVPKNIIFKVIQVISSDFK